MFAAVLDVLLLAQEPGAAIDQNPVAETIVFWVFAVIALGSGIAVITMRNIVHSALMLVLNLLSIAALYLSLQSQFLGIIQVLVYAGAIMVLFLFVIMLLGVDRDDLLLDTQRWHRVGAVVGGALLAAGLLFAFSGAFDGAAICGGDGAGSTAPGDADFECRGLEQALAQQEHGSVSFLAERMFTRWTFPFEAASLLLVVATIGALVLGRREDLPRATPAVAGTPGGEHVPPADDGGATTSTPEGTPSDADRLLPDRDPTDEGR